MSLATFDADGLAPSGPGLFARLRLHLKANPHEIALGGQLLAVALAAFAAMLTPALRPHLVHAASVAALQLPTGAPVDFAETVDSKLILQDLLTKAGLRPNFELRHLSWTQARRLNALNTLSAAPFDTAKPFSLALDTKNGKEALHCLTQAAYFEAGGRGPDAEAAVVQVVLNRVRHPDFPKTVCGVVYQGAEHETGCQFTFACDGALNRPQDAVVWEEARQVAARALGGYVVKAVGASTYYHADYVFPAWAPALVKTATVGPHIFYRMPGQEGRASYLTGQYMGGELKLRTMIQHALDAHLPKPDEPATAPKLEVSAAPKGLQVQADRNARVHAQYAGVTDAKPAAAEVVKTQAASVGGESPAPLAAADDSKPAA